MTYKATTTLLIALTTVAVGGCGGSDAEKKSELPPGAPIGADPSKVDPTTRNVPDAPEISRSAGVAGGITILWPRVSPKNGDTGGVAASLQQRLVRLAQAAAPGVKLDVRPDPERVCPKAGCAGVALGAVLFAKGPSCAAAALVASPGKAPFKLIPWGGQSIKATQELIPFREPPDKYFTVDDFAACSEFDASLKEHDLAVIEAIKTVMGDAAVAPTPPASSAPAKKK